MNIMKNTDLTQQAVYTAPSVRVVNVNMRFGVLQDTSKTPGGGEVL